MLAAFSLFRNFTFPLDFFLGEARAQKRFRTRRFRGRDLAALAIRPCVLACVVCKAPSVVGDPFPNVVRVAKIFLPRRVCIASSSASCWAFFWGKSYSRALRALGALRLCTKNAIRKVRHPVRPPRAPCLAERERERAERRAERGSATKRERAIFAIVVVVVARVPMRPTDRGILTQQS